MDLVHGRAQPPVGVHLELAPEPGEEPGERRLVARGGSGLFLGRRRVSVLVISASILVRGTVATDLPVLGENFGRGLRRTWLRAPRDLTKYHR